ncbi:imidazolonepropionase-like amidohydrolase [Sphingomonas zeicaulis]|uniref:amidohydrolase family protein n=1 Tax=Sphingomonas zeicaulis TaxID=1632740 RepID=UPI003D1D9FC5
MTLRNSLLRTVALTGAALFTATAATAQAPAGPAATEQPPKAWFGPQAAPYKVETPIALIHGLLIDATGAPAKPRHTVLIDGGKIKAVGPDGSIPIPSDARVFDASGMTIMPGLINSNQHIQLNPLFPAPVADLPIADLRARWEANFANMPRKAFVYLMQGVTTMRQTSGPYKRELPVKQQIDSGQIPGPRIMLGGALIMSRQHFQQYTEKNRTPAEAMDWLENDFAYFVVDDIDKDLAKIAGPEFNYWKLYLGDEVFDGKNDFTDEQLRKIIAKGHALGKKIDVHANSTPEGFARLLKFDIDTLEHPFETDFLLDEKTIAGFAKKGVIADTLLRVRVTAAEHQMDPNRFNTTDYIMSSTPEEYRIIMNYRDKMLYNKRNPDHRGLAFYEKRASNSDMFGQSGPSFNDQMKGRETARENMRRFIKAGVKFSMGTDSTSFLNFQQDDPNATEMAYMVELGMTPMDSIIASTRNGAEMLGMSSALGTVEVGKIADVIVVAGNPLEDIGVMKNVAIVIKDGIRFK